MKLKAIVMCALLLPGIAFAATTPDAASVQTALDAAAPAKLSVSEGFYKTGHWATSNAEAGYTSPADALATISIGQAGVITIKFAGPTITLTPSDGGNGRVNWSCMGTGFADDALPAACE